MAPAPRHPRAGGLGGGRARFGHSTAGLLPAILFGLFLPAAAAVAAGGWGSAGREPWLSAWAQLPPKLSTQEHSRGEKWGERSAGPGSQAQELE